MLVIESLTADYNQHPVLHDFSLDVAPGEVATVIGPNGCGKSTMLRCVAGLMHPQRGRVTLEGADVTAMDVRERARHIALLPQT
ncbi:MAG: ATP-binding cassette domain-containing protein, partial [Armatimonadota bacterium]|nr:ATP-binding cassette domain-containing protein [Armatimonadota bacterium]